MKTIILKNGFVKYPNHWIAIKNINPQEATQCGVLAFRNSLTYNIPTFLFFLNNKTIQEMDSKDQEQIYHACQKKYPEFNSLLEKQVDPKYDINNTIINIKEWDEAPTIGWFHVFDADEDYGPFNDALIYRTK